VSKETNATERNYMWDSFTENAIIGKITMFKKKQFKTERLTGRKL
jgi:hypothetical protein